MNGQTQNLDQALVAVLDELELRMGFELTINSGYRDKEHNHDVGGVENSEHTMDPAQAADVLCVRASTRYRMLRELYAMHITRIGIGETFIHVGVSTDHPIEVAWHYYPMRRAPQPEGSKTV